MIGQWLRNAHAKQHGCLQAYITPLQGLPSNLAVGIFAQPVTYPAFIRYSNGLGRGFFPLSNPMDSNGSDANPDVRGMAFKIFNVSGNWTIPNVDTQTFTFTGDNIGFLDSQENTLSYFQAIQGGKLATAAWMIRHPHLSRLLIGTAHTGVIPSLLNGNFWQAAPQSHGVGQTAKYHL